MSTVQLTHILRELEQDAYGAGGRTVQHRVATLQATDVTRHESKRYTLSAGVSNREVTLDPITASDPGQILWLTTNQPVDLRVNASNATLWSAVRQLMCGTVISALYLTTVDSAVTTLRLDVFGGGSVTVSEPSP
jgi:hypothetical protein